MASESMLTRAARFCQLSWRVMLREIGVEKLQDTVNLMKHVDVGIPSHG